MTILDKLNARVGERVSVVITCGIIYTGKLTLYRDTVVTLVLANGRHAFINAKYVAVILEEEQP